jgi:hypothetical protein
MKSELWRRDHIKVAIDILDQDILEFHPKYQLKKATEASILDSKKEIIAQLSNMSEVKAIEPKKVEDVATRAARFWLECGSNWARLRLIMADPSNESPQGKSSGGEKTRKLVINPGLKLIGNSIGAEFEKESIVEGCNGKFTTMKV